MRPMPLAIPLLIASACSSSTPTSPTAVAPQGASATAATAAVGVRGVVTLVGSPAPGTLTVQIPGGPVAAVDADGRFQFASVPVTVTSLILRADGRESLVRVPISPAAGAQLQIDLRFDVATGVAVLSRVCTTSDVNTGAPGLVSIVSMCVAGG
ncbi:hypothetical protein [Luteitalea sp.]|uniref:hypothetical protein n=1 Tax=Luteitalea sp. TaxID=2004800 RepID=UPI0025C644BF|nr:hypothetical protein [Luteitalea sp.]